MLKGVRYQKRIQLGKFLRLNISKSGIGLSVGVRGLRYTVGPSGSHLTVGLPGSGIRYQRKVGNRKGLQFASLKKLLPRQKSEKVQIAAKSLKRIEAGAPVEPAEVAKPGFFAPKWEKALYDGLTAYRAGDAMTAIDQFWIAVNERDADLGVAIILAYLLSLLDQAKERTEAISLLESVITSDAIFPTPIMEKYMADIELDIDITPQIEVTLPIQHGLASALLLVEEYQEAEAFQPAIDLLEEVNEAIAEGHKQQYDEVITLSLVELYLATENYRAIIDTVEPPEVAEDDVHLGILFFYARALQETNLHDGAIQVFNKAMQRRKGLSPELHQACRLWRAMSYVKVKRRSQARKELERVVAETSSDRLKRSALQTLQAFWPEDFSKAVI